MFTLLFGAVAVPPSVRPVRAASGEVGEDKVVVDETTLVVVRPGGGGGGGEEERSVTRRCWREVADVGEGALRQVGRCAGDHRSPSVCTQAPVSDFVCLCRSERPMATVACYRAACPHTSAAWLGGAGGTFAEEEEGGHRGGKKLSKTGCGEIGATTG